MRFQEDTVHVITIRIRMSGDGEQDSGLERLNVLGTYRARETNIRTLYSC